MQLSNSLFYHSCTIHMEGVPTRYAVGIPVSRPRYLNWVISINELKRVHFKLTYCCCALYFRRVGPLSRFLPEALPSSIVRKAAPRRFLPESLTQHIQQQRHWDNPAVRPFPVRVFVSRRLFGTVNSRYSIRQQFQDILYLHSTQGCVNPPFRATLSNPLHSRLSLLVGSLSILHHVKIGIHIVSLSFTYCLIGSPLSSTFKK